MARDEAARGPTRRTRSSTARARSRSTRPASGSGQRPDVPLLAGPLRRTPGERPARGDVPQRQFARRRGQRRAYSYDESGGTDFAPTPGPRGGSKKGALPRALCSVAFAGLPPAGEPEGAQSIGGRHRTRAEREDAELVRRLCDATGLRAPRRRRRHRDGRRVRMRAGLSGRRARSAERRPSGDVRRRARSPRGVRRGDVRGHRQRGHGARGLGRGFEVFRNVRSEGGTGMGRADAWRYFNKRDGRWYRKWREPGSRKLHQQLGSRWTWERANGPIPPGHEIHHKNRDHADNALDNLECITEAEHDELHQRERRDHVVIDGVEHRRCQACGDYLKLDCFYPRTAGTFSGYCKPCSGKPSRAVERSESRAVQRLHARVPEANRLTASTTSRSRRRPSAIYRLRGVPDGHARRRASSQPGERHRRGARPAPGTITPTLKSVDLATRLAATIKPIPHADGSPLRLLVPFAGSGTEPIGGVRAGWDEILGIEADPHFVAIARARIARWAEVPLSINEKDVARLAKAPPPQQRALRMTRRPRSRRRSALARATSSPARRAAPRRPTRRFRSRRSSASRCRSWRPMRSSSFGASSWMPAEARCAWWRRRGASSPSPNSSG